MFKLVLIAVGGALGSVLRYLIQGWTQALTGKGAVGTFPLGTLLVNVTGCLAIGFLFTLFTGPYVVREEYRVGILVGILGGYTTFSSFALETLNLTGAGQPLWAILNITASVIVGLLACWLGMIVARALYGA